MFHAPKGGEPFRVTAFTVWVSTCEYKVFVTIT